MDMGVPNVSSAYQILSVLFPSNSSMWHERTDSWFTLFYLMMFIYSLIFFGLAFACVFLLIKRHLVQRFRVRTFIAIDLALIILGFSRVIFIFLDPWGQQGFCNHLTCVIISRLLGALAFPSLTASYTLVFITLWISARMHFGRSWIQKIKILIPFSFLHYGVAIVFEIIALLPLYKPMVVIQMLIICEGMYSIWGFLVCFMFMIAGLRLLKTLKTTVKNSSKICIDSSNINRMGIIARYNLKEKDSPRKEQSTMTKMQDRQSTRKLSHGQLSKSIWKVTLITYITVFLGMIYSCVILFNLVFIVMSIFNDGCLGMIRNKKRYPELWLTFHCVFFTLEVFMSVLLIYTISNTEPLIIMLKNCYKCKRKDRSPSGIVADPSSSSTGPSSTTLVISTV